jgi:putative salt-induced outer membrane protein
VGLGRGTAQTAGFILDWHTGHCHRTGVRARFKFKSFRRLAWIANFKYPIGEIGNRKTKACSSFPLLLIPARDICPSGSAEEFLGNEEGTVSTTRVTTMFVVGILISTNAFADQITLKNGDRLTGEIIKSDEKTLVVKSEYAGEVMVQWAAVDAITSTHNLHVGLKDGQTVVGTVTTHDGRIQLQTREAGQVTTTKDSIQVIRSDKEQAAYEAEIDRLRHPRLTDFWSGFLDVGLSTTKGNSDTLNFALGAKAVRAAPNDKITAYANSIFAKNNTTGPSVTTAHAITGGIRGDLNLTNRVFVFGLADFEYDQFQKLDLRNVLGGGLGYHFLKTDRTLFDVFGGGSYDQAFYSTGITRKSGEALLGEELSHKFSARSLLTEKLQLFPNLSDAGQYRITFDSTGTTKVSNWLNWQISFGDRYVSNPIPGIKKNDLLLTTGLRLTFGKGLL